MLIWGGWGTLANSNRLKKSNTTHRSWASKELKNTFNIRSTVHSVSWFTTQSKWHQVIRSSLESPGKLVKVGISRPLPRAWLSGAWRRATWSELEPLPGTTRQENVTSRRETTGESHKDRQPLKVQANIQWVRHREVIPEQSGPKSSLELDVRSSIWARSSRAGGPPMDKQEGEGKEIRLCQTSARQHCEAA